MEKNRHAKDVYIPRQRESPLKPRLYESTARRRELHTDFYSGSELDYVVQGEGVELLIEQ